MNISKELIQKYNIRAPRYTSYPTFPCWESDTISQNDWLDIVNTTFEESNQKEGISLYVHLPFCEVLCTYCACNTRITKNHKVEEGYITAVLSEWQMYMDRFEEKPQIRELHLGGGTPTFFSPKNLNRLIEGLLKDTNLHPDYEFCFEGHPNNTTKEHLQTLFDLGFRRVSFGIQDFDEKVQLTINRIQPYENVVKVTKDAREIGFTSINYDLIYGLPFQTLTSIRDTIEKVGKLMPDRIAFYSYAHVPWIKPGQRSYTEADLPDNDSKRALYELGREMLNLRGYQDIGMDHFALPADPLFKALEKKKLHRNFMGYTRGQTELLIGLGCSAISDAKYAYGQNLKKVEDYKNVVLEKKSAIYKGHKMSEEDLILRRCIISIACKGELKWEQDILKLIDGKIRSEIILLVKDGLIELDSQALKVTPLGQAFIRNICMTFDKRQRLKNLGEQPLFSKAI